MRGFLEGGLSAEPLNLLEIDSASGQVDSGIRGSAEALVFIDHVVPIEMVGFCLSRRGGFERGGFTV
jgi:hypothetical protein